MKIKFISFLLFGFCIFNFTNCNRADESWPPHPLKIKDSRGLFQGTYNGVNWHTLKPSSLYSTIAVFHQGFNRRSNCDNPNLITFYIVSLKQKIFFDFTLILHIDTSRVANFDNFETLNPQDSMLLCSGKPLVTADIVDYDELKAVYTVDRKRINFLKITRIAKDTIEGNFEFNFLESETFEGRKNMNSQNVAPDNLQVKSSKFIAIKDGSFGG